MEAAEAGEGGQEQVVGVVVLLVVSVVELHVDSTLLGVVDNAVRLFSFLRCTRKIFFGYERKFFYSYFRDSDMKLSLCGD